MTCKLRASSALVLAIALFGVQYAQASTYHYRLTQPGVRSPFLAPALSDFSVQALPVGSAPFALIPPRSDSDGVISYASSNPSVATLMGDMQLKAHLR